MRTTPDWVLARELLALGATLTEAARQCGAARRTLQLRARAEGWQRRRPGSVAGRTWPEPTRAAALIMRHHRRGASTEAIAEALGVTKRTVRHAVARWAPRMGLPLHNSEGWWTDAARLRQPG